MSQQTKLFTQLRDDTSLYEIDTSTPTCNIIHIGDRAFSLQGAKYVTYSPHGGGVCTIVYGSMDNCIFFYGADALRAYDLANSMMDFYGCYRVEQTESIRDAKFPAIAA